MTMVELRVFEKEQLGDYVLRHRLSDMGTEQIAEWLAVS